MIGSDIGNCSRYASVSYRHIQHIGVARSGSFVYYIRMGKDADERLYTEAEVQRLIAVATHPLLDRIEQLEAQIARMGKDSSNSSKPPSSDIVKPKATKSKGKKKAGGQMGHPRYARDPFPPDLCLKLLDAFPQRRHRLGDRLAN